jgi:hypothetical protein
MRILLACEESQAVCIEMRKLGHEAFSCDLLPCSGGHPEWHLQQDVTEILKQKWDMIIAFPPCTYLTVSNTYMKRGCSKYTADQAKQLRQDAIDFFMMFANADCEKIAIENPIGIMSTIYRKPDQVIQPFEFGHPESKATCLWLKGLPKLKPTEFADWKYYRCRCGNVFDAELGKYGCCDWPAKILWDNQTKSGQNKLPPSKDRHVLRAKTYPGIAKAMSEQWTDVS